VPLSASTASLCVTVFSKATLPSHPCHLQSADRAIFANYPGKTQYHPISKDSNSIRDKSGQHRSKRSQKEYRHEEVRNGNQPCRPIGGPGGLPTRPVSAFSSQSAFPLNPRLDSVLSGLGRGERFARLLKDNFWRVASEARSPAFALLRRGRAEVTVFQELIVSELGRGGRFSRLLKDIFQAWPSEERSVEVTVFQELIVSEMGCGVRFSRLLNNIFCRASSRQSAGEVKNPSWTVRPGIFGKSCDVFGCFSQP
jgi:hypothetical protein